MTSTQKPDPTTLGAKPLEAFDEETDLRVKLEAKGVHISDGTSLVGLRELWATFGDRPAISGPFLDDDGPDPRAETLQAEIEKRRVNEETTEPERELEQKPETETDEEPEPGIAETAAEILTAPGDDEPEETVAQVAERAAAAATKAGDGSTTLFDVSDFEREDLALPPIDGHPIDRIAVAFSGEVMLDRSNKDHVALFRRLKLGQKVELWVEAKGTGVSGKGATNREGDLDAEGRTTPLAVAAAGEPIYLSHFVTCPNAAQHRRSA